MKKKITLIIFVILSLLVIVGVVQKNRIKTSKNINPVEYTITHKCMEASTITTVKNDTKSLSYFSQCVCFVSYDISEPVGIDVVDSTYFEASGKQETVDLCNNGCQELCEKQVKLFLSEHPDFTIQRRL